MPDTKLVLARIRYCAFNPPTPQQEAELALAGCYPNARSNWIPLDADPTRILDLLHAIFEATNLQEGELWEERIEPRLPKGRTHTSVSSNPLGGGDEIDVYANRTLRTFRCDSFGWSVLTDDARWQAIVPATR
jgi:hypothetical protein